ncbi:unnamed protein product [Peronospora destructor]|uniref:Uncharacterized protein n=1 Tax=Peronospora destructor TaxID=86335 RepID=A0AAV0VBQ7_9STRA|nr:unnamed protein product [Peronospora destructor]
MEAADDAREEDVELWKAALDDDTFAKLSEVDTSYATHARSSNFDGRREIHARAKRPPKQNKDEHVTARMVGLTPVKRKLQEEHAKIQEAIQVIDRAREQARINSESQPQQRRPRPLLPGVEQGHAQQHPMTMEMVMVSAPSTMNNLASLHVPLDAMELLETISQIHAETRDVQREIVARLRSINCVISQHGGHGEMEEPSSASV